MILRMTNEECDELNAPKYKIISVEYARRRKINNKNKLELVVKVLVHIISKFRLENELSYLLN